MARRAARRLALPRKGPWLYDYGSLEEVLSSLRNWGKGIKLTRQIWDRYTLVDPTHPLMYCQITGYKRTLTQPMKPTYSMKYYRGDRVIPEQLRTVRKTDWRVLRDDDLLLAMNRECMGALEERRKEEGWTDEDIEERQRKEKEEKAERKNKMQEEMTFRLKEYSEKMDENKRNLKENLATFWKNQLEERKKKRSQAKQEIEEIGSVEANRDKEERKDVKADLEERKDVKADLETERKDVKADLEKERKDVEADLEERKDVKTNREKEEERVDVGIKMESEDKGNDRKDQ